MGTCLIIDKTSFDNSGLGKVSIKNGKTLESISIYGDPVVLSTGRYFVAYNPIDSSTRGVTWEIVSGSNYADIEQNGVVTAKSGANLSEVIIRATTSNSIYSEKTIYVSAAGAESEVEYVGSSADENELPLYINTGLYKRNTNKYEIEFAVGGIGENNITVLGVQAADGTGGDIFAQNVQYFAAMVKASNGNIYVVDRQRNYPYTTGVTASQNTKYKIVYDLDGVTKLYVNDSLTASYASSSGNPANIASNYYWPILLGAIAQRKGTSATEYNIIRPNYKEKLVFYGFRAYNDTDGNLAWYKPYVINGVPCFKDVVNGTIKYYNGTKGKLYFKINGAQEQQIDI